MHDIQCKLLVSVQMPSSVWTSTLKYYRFSWGGAVLIHDHTTVGWVYWFTLPSLAHKVAATRKTPLPTSTVSATAASAAITKIAVYQKGPRGFRPFIDKLVCTIWIQQHHKLWQISILQSGFLCNEQDKHTDFKSVIEHSISNHDFIQLQREREALHSADPIFLLHSWIWHRLPKTWIAHVRGQFFCFININSLEVFCLHNDWTSEVKCEHSETLIKCQRMPTGGLKKASFAWSNTITKHAMMK